MPGVKGDLRTFNVAVNAAFKTVLQGSQASQSAAFTTEVSMSTKRLEFPIAGTVGPLREWKGSRIIQSIIRDAYEIVAKKFEKTISIPVEDEEDDNLDVYMPAIRMLAYQTGAWKDQQVFKALEQNGNGYDKVPFFSTTHQEGGLNASNYVAGASPAWYLFDTTKPIKPVIWGNRVPPKVTPRTSDSDTHVFDKDEYLWGVRARGGSGYGLWQGARKQKTALDAPNFEAAVTAMRSRVDEEGETLDITPNLLVVPPALEFDAQRLFGRNILTTGEENIHNGGMKWITCNRLTGA
jgi:phage major head subunit gpT-like protein